MYVVIPGQLGRGQASLWNFPTEKFTLVIYSMPSSLSATSLARKQEDPCLHATSLACLQTRGCLQATFGTVFEHLDLPALEWRIRELVAGYFIQN